MWYAGPVGEGSSGESTPALPGTAGNGSHLRVPYRVGSHLRVPYRAESYLSTLSRPPPGAGTICSMNETERPDVGEYDAILDQIEVTEGVFALPAAVRVLSPDELEAAGLPRDFLTLSPVQKAAAVRAARGEPEELGRPEPVTSPELAAGDGDGEPLRTSSPESDFPPADAVQPEVAPYSVSSDAPRSDEELDAELRRFERESEPEPDPGEQPDVGESPVEPVEGPLEDDQER